MTEGLARPSSLRPSDVEQKTVLIMSADDLIEEAVKTGARHGLAALAGASRKVWLISEAETYCATNGMDSFLERYTDSLAETAEAFANVGAVEIGMTLRAIDTAQPNPPHNLLDDADRLINARVGYDYEAVQRFVSQEITS